MCSVSRSIGRSAARSAGARIYFYIELDALADAQFIDPARSTAVMCRKTSGCWSSPRMNAKPRCQRVVFNGAVEHHCLSFSPKAAHPKLIPNGRRAEFQNRAKILPRSVVEITDVMMLKVAEYRQHAADCRNMASNTKDLKQRQMFEYIAAAWDRLAAERENLQKLKDASN